MDVTDVAGIDRAIVIVHCLQHLFFSVMTLFSLCQAQSISDSIKALMTLAQSMCKSSQPEHGSKPSWLLNRHS